MDPFSRVTVVERTGSTNSDAVAALRADATAWPHLSVLRAEHQDAGRGRTGRTWSTPPGTALTASIVLRPGLEPARWPFLTLLGGLAVVTALRGLGAPAGLKWPNDVVLPDGVPLDGWGPWRKVGGILAEAVPDALPASPGEATGAVVLGIGVNVAQSAEQLPVPWATSLALAGVATTPSGVLDAVGSALHPLLPAWEDDGAASLLDRLREVTTTLGEPVAVDLPGGHVIEGVAADLDDAGRLVLAVGGATQVVDAGDVRHLRLA